MRLNFNKPIIVAEIGWNFLGNIKLAKKMITMAKASGADAVKFQLWNPKNLKPGAWDNDGRRKLYLKSYLDYKKFKLLYRFSKKLGIECFGSVFSYQDLEIHKNINRRIIKIPSSEAYDFKLIKLALKHFSKVIVSTGALSPLELKRLYQIRTNKLILLHCVSSYPLDNKNINFYKFKFLMKKFKNVGYSGHAKGINDAIWAIANGACLIEKHFTVDNNLKGRDNKFSILPKELSKVVDFKNFHHDSNSKKTLNILKCEKDVVKNYRGRWRINEKVK